MSAETPPEPWYRKHRKTIRALASVVVGAGLAMLCPLLPIQLQEPCRVAARIFGALN